MSGWKNQATRGRKHRELHDPVIFPGGPDHNPRLAVIISEPGTGVRYGRLDLDRHTIEFLHRELGKLLA